MNLSRFELPGSQATNLAEQFGTPLYVMDEASFRGRIKAFQDALKQAAPNSGVSFAAKSNTALALAKIAHEEGCTVDGSSEGELRGPLLAGVPASTLHFHGNVKLGSELDWALRVGIGQIIIDSFEEIELVSKLVHAGPTEYLLRVAPGVAVSTHEKIATGVVRTKFGFEVAQIESAIARCVEAGIRLVGLHQHVGSMLLTSEAQANGARRLAEIAANAHRKFGLEVKELNLGGGYGVKLEGGHAPQSLREYVSEVSSAALEVLRPAGLDPKLVMEPGRALTADSGVTLYEICTVKESGGHRYVSVDGGMADNPAPALYGRKFTIQLARESECQGRNCTVSGAHCETDTLFENMELPEDVRAGDILQVMGTGAYQASMSSNYNRFRRPAMVMLTTRGPKVIQERETWDQLFARERLQ